MTFQSVRVLKDKGTEGINKVKLLINDISIVEGSALTLQIKGQ